MPGALAILIPDAPPVAHHAKASWNMRGSWLMQEAAEVTVGYCNPQDPNCSMETTKVLILLISLCATLMVVICAFSFFREDKEEQITPLCPQLVVKDSELKFRLPALPLLTEVESSNNMDVLDNKENCVCKISTDWPDPFRGSPHGVAATVRLHKSDITLATIVARNVAVLGQGLALCRTGCEIFGFVEPDGNKYLVRHRTGVHLLTLIGSFGSGPSGQLDTWDIEGFNPVGSKVCQMKKVGDECIGKVSQYVDAGLVICAIMATYVHRRLSQPMIANAGHTSPLMASSSPAGPEALSPLQASREGGSPEDGAAVHLLAQDISTLRSPPQTRRELDTNTEEASTGCPAAAG